MAANDEGEMAGCLVVFWSAFVTTPMWLLLLFMVMSTAEHPTWVWALYWVYVPCQMVLPAFRGIWIAASKKNKE